MKSILFLSFSTIFLLNSCYTCTEEQEYDIYSPKYISRDSLNKSITGLPPQELVEISNFYPNGEWMYLIEKGKGVHIMDNSNPQLPEIKAFITIPDIRDLAVKNNTLLVNQNTDLVAIEVSVPNDPIVADRMENVFEEILPPLPPNSQYERPDPEKGIVIGWDRSTTKKFGPCE